jgi:DNA polymerase III delta prime subunit
MLTRIDHHAYVVAGQKESLIPLLLDMFENKFDIAINGNPDFSVIHFESFGIDESRKIKEMQSMKSLGASKRIFVISTNAITVQAQNAMLKMFEEPTENTHFFIIVPSTSFFIDTLLSRMVVLENDILDKVDKTLNAKDFLKMTYPERLKMIEKFLKAFKDNKEGKSVASNFFSEIEVVLAKDVKKNKEALEKLLEIKKYVFDTSSSLKILLETLALTLPVY